MKKLLFVFLMLVSCCAPKVLPPKPQVQPSVVPAIAKVEDNTVKLKATVAKQKEIIKSQKSEIDESIRLAEELRKQLAENMPDVPNENSTKLVDLLNSVKERNLFLEETVENLAGELSFAELNLAEAKALAKGKDLESQKWEKAYNDLSLEYADKEEELKKAEVKAATAGVYRNWIIGLAVGYVLWLIIKNILMVYFPASQFLRRV